MLRFQNLGSILSLVIICTLFVSCTKVSRPELDAGEVVVATSDDDPSDTKIGNSDIDNSHNAQDARWGRFRGPNGTGISLETNLPIRWNEQENLQWKTRLPGAGSSSPVLTKRHAFVTSYSGYGMPGKRDGSPDSLQRHLSCIDRNTGDVVWTKTIDNEQREDPYQGMGVPEHGYATNTPVTDGQSVFVFYGKSGVLAYDLDGKQLWKRSVGTSSGNRRWGSAASLILLDDKLIVNAAEESKTIFALDKSTGNVVWKTEVASLELCYSTPAVVRVDDKRKDLVIAVPGEVWGLNPSNGKLTWYVETSLTGNLSPSVIVDGKTIYVFGGYRSSGSLAIRAGGKGNVTDSNVLWTSRNSSYVATPVVFKNRIYWIDDKGIYFCLDAKSGEIVHKKRAPMKSGGGRPVYASPIAIGDKVYIQTRYNGLLVVQPADELDVIETNQFTADDSQFNATPATDNGQLFLRSDQFVYCVRNQ